MTQAHSVILKIDGLTKLHGQFKALNSISFSINRGEIFGLLGPNGAGKSTLMRCMAGLDTPLSGSITVGGNATNGQGTSNTQGSATHGSNNIHSTTTGNGSFAGNTTTNGNGTQTQSSGNAGNVHNVPGATTSTTPVVGSSSGNWKYSLTNPAGWANAEFDDSSWLTPVAKVQTAAPWGNKMPINDGSAGWIWSTEPYNDNNVYFRIGFMYNS